LLLLVCLPRPGQAAAPGEFVVSQTLDSGPYSLRAGIEFANSHPGPDIIRFDPNITGRTILLGSNLPPLTLTDDGTTIDASPNWIGSWPVGEPGITLRPLNFDDFSNGLIIHGADNCTIKGLLIEGFYPGIRLLQEANGNTIGSGSPGGRMVIQSFSNAIEIIASNGNRVIGSYIGTSKAGNLPEPYFGTGIHIDEGDENEIGGIGPLEGNIIGASQADYGIEIWGDNNTVIANRIGVGMLDGDIPNELGGIYIVGSYNKVGGTSPETGNWISGNGGFGVVIVGANSGHNNVSWNVITDNSEAGVGIDEASQNTIHANIIVGNGRTGVHIGRGSENYIYSNFIGTDASGNTGLGNGQHGLVLDDGARSNRVEGNVIAQNKESGIVIVSGNTTDNIILNNYIGLTPNGQPLGNTYYGVGVIGSPRNAIHSNVIAYNGAPAGVWITEAAAVGNEVWFNSIYNNTGPGIVLTNGGNQNLAAPAITHVQCPQVSGVGAPANGKVQLFSDEADEGRFYEGETQANSSGQWVYSGGFHGPHLTATASDSENNTSAFSAPAAGSFCGMMYLPVIRR
jgi:hypothetical protein